MADIFTYFMYHLSYFTDGLFSHLVGFFSQTCNMFTKPLALSVDFIYLFCEIVLQGLIHLELSAVTSFADGNRS